MQNKKLIVQNLIELANKRLNKELSSEKFISSAFELLFITNDCTEISEVQEILEHIGDLDGVYSFREHKEFTLEQQEAYILKKICELHV